MRVGLAQINPTLGDFTLNAEKIIKFVHEAKEKKCSLIVFPECSLFGYHPFDLLERKAAVHQQTKELKKIMRLLPKDIQVLIGIITERKSKKGRPYHNSAVLLKKNKILKQFHKTLLPTGDVFDEARFIEPGDITKNIFKIQNKNVLLTICEDIWAWPNKKGTSIYQHNPLEKIKKNKVDFVINMSASPWYLGKMKMRHEMISKTAAYFKSPMIYVNMVGGQDEIVFDGQSLVYDERGKKVATCLAFEESLNILDLQEKKMWSPTPALNEAEELRQALVLGLRDFVHKNGLEKVHLGLSGGIDSALVLCLAVEAFGASKVKAFALPGPFSAAESLQLAKNLAKNLNVSLQEISIEALYQLYVEILNKSLDVKKFGLVHENIQARIRGDLLMAYANKENSLLLSTSNKSELASGYSTLYGDMCGGLAPLGDLTKEQVYQLCRYYNREIEVIPQRIIDRPPTAELRENQKDQDTLPPYALLDQMVKDLVVEGKAAQTEQEKWLIKQIFKTEFKRWQAPPILKVSQHAFGRGRRYPIAHKFLEN